MQKDVLEKRKKPEKHIIISNTIHDFIHKVELQITLQGEVIKDTDKIHVSGFKRGAFKYSYDVYRKQSNASELVHNVTLKDLK